MTRNPSLLRVGHIACILALILLLLSACGEAEKKRLSIGDPAPEFSTIALDGQPISLQTFDSNPVILRFFTIDCKFCRVDTPAFNSFYDKHKGQGLKMVYINTDENSEGIEGFVEGTGITFPVILDPQHLIADSFSVVKVPLTIILNPQHQVSGALLGGVSEEQLEEFTKDYFKQ